MQRPTDPSQDRARVLVIDDEPMLTLTLARVLGDEGFEVHVAYDGAEGLAIARTARPAVIILDLHMPILDGFGFIDAFRDGPDASDVPIILATAAQDVANAQRRVADKGVVLFVAKPFDMDTLLTAVDAVLHNRGR